MSGDRASLHDRATKGNDRTAGRIGGPQGMDPCSLTSKPRCTSILSSLRPKRPRFERTSGAKRRPAIPGGGRETAVSRSPSPETSIRMSAIARRSPSLRSRKERTVCPRHCSARTSRADAPPCNISAWAATRLGECLPSLFAAGQSGRAPIDRSRRVGLDEWTEGKMGPSKPRVPER